MDKAHKIDLLAIWWRDGDIISYGNGVECIVIGSKKYGINTVQLTVYPYKRYSKRWKQWLWMKWLRFRIYFKIIKA